MKVRHLRIEQFGLFVDRELEFSGDALQLIHGPNEAGKSTLLQLLRETLFGFAVRNPYAFPEHTGEMAALVTLEMADGRQLRFRRRKGRRDTVVGEFLDDGQPIDEAALARLLGGASLELFQNVFAFSLSELAAGQRSLEHAKLSEALYGGALGGLAGFRGVLDGLEKEHDALYSPSATKRPINQLLAHVRKQAKQLRQSQMRPRDYKQMADETRQLCEQSQRLRQERDRLQREQSRCEQLARSLELWQQRSPLMEELARFELPDQFPRDGQRQYEQYRTLRDRVAGELDEIEQELAETRQRLEALAPRADMIERVADIHQLAQQIDKIRGFRRDIVLRQQESASVKAAVRSQLSELDPSWSLEHLAGFQTTLAQRTAMEQMREKWDQLQQRRRDVLAQRPALQNDIDDLQRQLDTLPEQHVTGTLASLVQEIGQYETRLERLEQDRQQRRELSRRLATLTRKLVAPRRLDENKLADLPVPLAATVREYRQQRGELAERYQRSALKLERAEEERDQRHDELRALRAADRVPSREELEEHRARRDRGWKLIRRRYIEDETLEQDELTRWLADPSIELPDAYEDQVRVADDVADQRQQQAESVARLDQMAVAAEQASRRCEEYRRAHGESTTAIDHWNQRWEAVWRPCGIDPDGPDAMLEWLQEHEELLETLSQADAVHTHQQEQRQWLERYESQLRGALENETEPLSALIAQSRDRVREVQDLAAQRKSYAAQLPRKQQQLAQLDNELHDVQGEIEAWRQRWESLLKQCGFPVDWNVHTATTVLAGIADARRQQEKAEVLDQRVRDMQSGLSQFETEVVSLCEQVACELMDHPPENAVEELVRLLEQSRQEMQEQKSLQKRKTTLEARCQTRQHQLKQEQASLNQLLQLAGAADESSFLAVARQASRAYALSDQLAGIDQQLRALRGNEDQMAFEEALEEVDAVELESRQRMLNAERERVEQQFDEALRQQGIAEDRLRQLEQANQAATLAQTLEGTRSQLAEQVDRWASLLLARTFMLRAMERFQREHQPALLTDIGRLVRRMTAGRYLSISRKLDQRGSLQVHQADGRVKEPHQLSTGTREQLYLAIRLGYVLHYCREAEPLPIMMDDVLVNFDDRRAAETLDALIELSRDIQLILLTCHQQTVDMARSRLPNLQPIMLGE